MTAELTRLIAGAFLPDPPKSMGVAVSGGGDSMALLYLLHDFASNHSCSLHVATVNHGLRPEAVDEVAMVGKVCSDLGLHHDVLDWQGWDQSGNVQGEARNARYRLLADWGKKRNLDVIALGHTADDQAETFVMRLARRAGLDGLCAIPQRFVRGDIQFARPLLAARRADLQAYLRAAKITWIDDPSNEDLRFERVRIRKAMAILEGVGVETAALCAVSHHLCDAKEALDHQMFAAARDLVSLHSGAVAIDQPGLAALPLEVRRRLIRHALKWVNGAYYSPRSSALAHVMDALSDAPSATVQGCELRHKGKKIWVFRELQAVFQTTTSASDLWDWRWRLIPPTEFSGQTNRLTVRALGADGLKSCPNWRELGVPRGALLSSPAVWDGQKLIAAPLAGWAQNWQVASERGENTFFSAHITH